MMAQLSPQRRRASDLSLIKIAHKKALGNTDAGSHMKKDEAAEVRWFALPFFDRGLEAMPWRIFMRHLNNFPRAFPAWGGAINKSALR